jgi:hypothetical protein
MPPPYAGGMNWEYKTPSAWSHPTARAALEVMQPILNKLGQEGWELVNFAIDMHEVPDLKLRISVPTFGCTCVMKRPIAP